MKRRDFITVMGTAAVVAPVVGTLASCASNPKTFVGHEFPELGFGFDELEPHIDAMTMEIHYNKHHKGYFKKFMAAAEGTELLDTPMEVIFANISKHSPSVRNNGGGFYNHALFWENLTPSQGQIPAKLNEVLVKDFDSIENFKEKFNITAKTHFGSGWAWLSVNPEGKLFVSSTANQDNPLMDVISEKGTPLLGLDVWEHAYYLNYQNQRGSYVENFWNVVNWDIVAKRLHLALG